jgi:hypothetical protein
MKMKRELSSDSGYALGLVLIFVMAVGTVLGSVMMVTQLSSDAQGRGVDQLQASNDSALAVSGVIEQYAQEAAANFAIQLTQDVSNCGLPSDLENVKISCQVISGADSLTEKVARVSFVATSGKSLQRDFKVSVNPRNGSQSVEQVTL